MTIGLTGGIGSGKSTVARIFELLGAAVFSSDHEAKLCYYDVAVKSQIIELLGRQAYTDNGRIDRAFIAGAIFTNTALLQRINNIIHPAVQARMKAFEQVNGNTLIVKETALLFEARLEATVDKIVVVTAPIELRIKRSMQRDGVTSEQVEERISKQLSQEEKVKRAHFVIDNSERVLLIPQVITLFQKLIS